MIYISNDRESKLMHKTCSKTVKIDSSEISSHSWQWWWRYQVKDLTHDVINHTQAYVKHVSSCINTWFHM